MKSKNKTAKGAKNKLTGYAPQLQVCKGLGEFDAFIADSNAGV